MREEIMDHLSTNGLVAWKIGYVKQTEEKWVYLWYYIITYVNYKYIIDILSHIVF